MRRRSCDGGRVVERRSNSLETTSDGAAGYDGG